LKENFMLFNLRLVLDRVCSVVEFLRGNNAQINENICALIKKRDKAFSKWKRYRTPQHFEVFASLRKQANKSIKLAKTQYYSEKFSRAANGRATWRAIKEIGLNKTSHQTVHADLNELNKIFVGNDFCDNSDSNRQPICDTIETNMQLFCDNTSNSAIPSLNTFSFTCVSESEVLYSLLSVKSNSVGLDGIHPKFIKLLLPKLLPYITFIFNTIITKSEYPKTWKIAKIIPIPKGKDDFRPIAILPYLSKALKVILYKQMNAYFTLNSLLTVIRI